MHIADLKAKIEKENFEHGNILEKLNGNNGCLVELVNTAE
jgi:hypothetical protein